MQGARKGEGEGQKKKNEMYTTTGLIWTLPHTQIRKRPNSRRAHDSRVYRSIHPRIPESLPDGTGTQAAAHTPPQCRAMAGRRRPSKTLPRSTEKPPPCGTEADRSFACVMSGFCSNLGTTREEGLLRKLPNPKPSAIPRRIPARVRLYLLYASLKLSWVITTWKMAIRWKT